MRSGGGGAQTKIREMGSYTACGVRGNVNILNGTFNGISNGVGLLRDGQVSQDLEEQGGAGPGDI